MAVGTMRVDASWAPTRHSHPMVEMMVVLSGSLTVEIAGTPWQAGPGAVLHYAAGASHLERADGSRPCEFIYFSLLGDPPAPRPMAHDGDGRLRTLAAWMLAESLAPSRERSTLDALLEAFVAEFGRSCAGAAPTMADAVRERMRQSLARPLTVTELAGWAGMSRAHFIRSYRTLTGATPMDDLRRMRVEAARDLVIRTGMPLRAIAAEVGFADEYHLSHVFRRVLGTAPGYYRRRG